MYKIVICNGGYKTGSTLSFNMALRLVESVVWPVESFGAKHHQITTLCDLDTAFLRSWWVIKSHSYVPLKVYEHVRVIHTDRNPCAVAASCLAMKWADDPATLDSVLATLKSQKELLAHHRGRTDTLILSYDKMYWQLYDALVETAVFLGLEVSDVTLSSIAEELSVNQMAERCKQIPDGEADSRYQLRGDNVGAYKGDPNAWKQVLSPEFVQRINTEVGGT